MNLIKTTQELASYCKYAAGFDYITVDTEFLREKTYFSKLCLVQIAVQSDSSKAAVVIDPLSSDIDLTLLLELFENKDIVKVFHAARQDLEIFFQLFGSLPKPIFDTQIAAMVCGFGDQIGYDNLVKTILNKTIDKSSRFTDWSRRPLSNQQLNYAIGDVTFLREIYEYLDKKLIDNQRSTWVAEELEILTSEDTYKVDPSGMWKRIKIKSTSGKVLAILRELASFREIYAQSKNIPRNRVLKDETILELCSVKPLSNADLKTLRSYNFSNRSNDLNSGVLLAIKQGMNCPLEKQPIRGSINNNNNKNMALSDMLRVLLKSSSENIGVAQKLIATTSDLDLIASGESVDKIFRGWRYDIFGKDALRLCQGKIGLAVNKNKIVTLDISQKK